MRSFWLVFCAVIVTHPVAAFQTIDTAVYFPAVVQGHRGNTNSSCNGLGNPLLTQFNQAKISGTGGLALRFCLSNQGSGMPTDGCDNANGSRRLCSVSNSTIKGLPITVGTGNNFLSGNGSSGGVSFCSAGQALSLGSASQYQFSTLAFYNTCTVSFSADRTDYRIQKLEAGSGAKLILPTGDYWIDQLTLNQGAEIEVQGNVRIFVNQAAQLNGAVLNRSSLGSLLLFGYQDITLNSDTLLNGYVYSDASLVMNNTAVINGRTTSRALTMTTSSAINDQPLIPSLSCFSDTFSSGTLSSDWVVNTSSGSFIPSIASGRLRLTQAVGDQATSTTYQRLFPAANNLVTISFNHYAYGGDGADGMAVVLSDAKVTPQPGAFGGPLGYGFKPGISGFAGGWLGIGFDEYGNYSGEGGTVNIGARPQSVVIRGSGSGTNGYNYLKGTCNNGTTNFWGNCLSPAVDGNGSANYKYQLTIDSRITGQSMVKVERDTGSGYVTLIDGFNAQSQSGQSQVPSNFLFSLTGSTGGLTNIHELDNVQICALQSSPIGVQIDHFELGHSGQGLTCSPETVTIKACANAACTSLVTDPVTATLSLTPTASSNGWVGGNSVTFSGGSTTVQLRNSTATSVTIGVSGSTPTTKPFSTTLCKAGSGVPSTAACTLDFADSGFVFDIPDTYSNQPQAVTLKAVKKSDVTKQCVPGFASQTKTVQFWSSYLTPASNPYNSKMSVNNSPLGTTLATATSLPLTFDAQGQSTITVNYPDAGQVQLDARYDGSGSESGLVMTGTDQFVARPVGLCLTSSSGTCSSDYANCPVFKKTGETFPLQIQAVAWESNSDADLCAGNLATPNFSLGNIALGSTLVAPSPGNSANVGTSSYNHVAATNSSNSVNQTISEVGVFRLTATPPANDYFSYTIPSAQSQPIGRFVPTDFNLANGAIVPTCQTFTYMGQPFGVQLNLSARNQYGETTLNYKDAFAKGVGLLSAANNQNGVPLSGRINTLLPLLWSNGQAAMIGSTLFARLSDTQPDGPYSALLFGLAIQDNDGGKTLINGANFNEAVVGQCSGASCNAKQIGTATSKVYFGRLMAGTEAGEVTAPLAISQTLQYFNGSDWVKNSEDNGCTNLSLANDGIAFTSGHTFNPSSRELDLGSNHKILLGLGASPPGGSSAQSNQGEILFHFAKPEISVHIPYVVDLSKQPSAPLWLSDPQTLQGTAIFGENRGNDRVIYEREILQ